MTIIAAAISPEGAIYMGGDGASLYNGDCLRFDDAPKVWRSGEYLIGATGTLRVCQIARFLFEPPKLKEADAQSFMIRNFIEALKASMKEHGGEIKGEDDGLIMDGRLLVGTHGRLYEVDTGYGVITSALGFHAIGCASQVAMGAMYGYNTGTGENMNAPWMVEVALEASAKFDMNIRRPFTIESINGKAKAD